MGKHWKIFGISIVDLIALMIGVILVLFAIFEIHDINESAKWPNCNGSIKEIKRESSTTTSASTIYTYYYIRLRYNYTSKLGKNYKGQDRIRFSELKSAEEALAKYKANKSIRIYSN